MTHFGLIAGTASQVLPRGHSQFSSILDNRPVSGGNILRICSEWDGFFEPAYEAILRIADRF